jgi:hypothetical protein
MPRSYIAAVILFLSHFFCDAQFENFSEEWNIPTGSYDAFFGNGVSVFDYDGDNIDNVTIAHPYIGIYGFQVSQGQMSSDFFIPLPLNIKQLLWADFNNDGDKELFVTTYGSGLFLYDYVNGELIQLVDAFSSIIFGFHYGASTSDFDNDGDLDIFVCQYFNYQFGSGHPNLLFRNDGNFIFTEIGESLGVNTITNNSFQSVWLDFNRDGWQDLYVINDKNIPNLFFQNNNGLSFTEIAGLNNSNIAMSCMSNSISDFNRDGFFDVFITDGATPVLLSGDSSGVFSEVANENGFGPFQTGWGALWIDDNFDGWDDLHICQGGTVLTPMNNQYYQNNDGAFIEMNSFDVETKASFVNAKGDLNGDCFPDFVVMNASPNSYDVWKGISNENNYFKLKLEGTISNKDAAGAIVEAYSNSGLTMKALLYGDNYISQSSNVLLFGVGNSEIIDSICIYWPRGLIEKFYSIEVNHSYLVIEGSSEITNNELLTYSLNYCHNTAGILITPSQEWVHWQWQDGNQDSSILAFSDTILHATAWNIQNQSFDLIYNISFSSPFPEIAVDQSECSYDSSIISINKGADWSLSHNQNEFFTDTIYAIEGIHFLSFTHNFGCSLDTVIQIDAITPATIAKNIQSACPENLVEFSIVLENSEISNYSLAGLENWSGFLPSGVYPFVITEITSNCEYADTLVIEQRTSPNISVLNDSICENSMSSFEIEINDNSLADWSIINSEYIEQESVLSVTIQDTMGCLYSEDVSVLISSYISVFPSEQTMNEQQILSLNPIGGIPPYAIFWQDSLFADSFVLASDGWVVYEVTDQLGCTHIGSYYFQQSIDINEFPEYFDLFFNGDMLFCSNCNQCTYSILSMNGGLVEAGVFKNAFLNLGALDKGIYIVRVNNEVLKFVN